MQDSFLDAYIDRAMADIFRPDEAEAEEEFQLADEPLLEKMPTAHSIALTGIFVLGILYSLYFAKSVIAPLVFATLLNFLFSPVVRKLKKWNIPDGIGAGIVLIVSLAAIGYGFYALSIPASEWFARLPQGIRKIESQVRDFRKPMEKVTSAAERVSEMTKISGAGGEQKQQVQIHEEPPLLTRVFSGAYDTVISAGILIILLYFMLASGDLFLRKLIKVLPRFRDKRLAVDLARRIEDHISSYMFTITAIFAGMGVAVGTVTWLAGLPTPLLWGVMAAVFNYVPYVGAAAGIGIVTLVSFMTFNLTTHALVAPAVYLALSIVEGQLITPIILGKRMALNPVVVFISLIFWGWMWGIVGAFLAIPMVSSFKIFCDQIEPLAPIGEFLGQ